MKKLIVSVLVALMLAMPTYGDVVKSGNTFIQTSSKTTITKKQVTKTKYTWQDSKGNTYPIYISESGSCFIYKVSKKTGKEYKQYLGKEVSMQICKELGITYKSK